MIFAQTLVQLIDEDAKKALDQHLAWLEKNANASPNCHSRTADAYCSFVGPALNEISSLSQLNREKYGPLLHVIRFDGEKLGEVVDQINATGYGLTLGLQSRIDTAVRRRRSMRVSAIFN